MLCGDVVNYQTLSNLLNGQDSIFRIAQGYLPRQRTAALPNIEHAAMPNLEGLA
jgi:hypothetical protein